MPANILTQSKIKMIFAVSLAEEFFFNKIIKPNPAPVDSPAITEPKLIACSTYSIVIRTDTAQFGISPIIAESIGCKGELYKNTCCKCPSDNIKIQLRTIDTARINAKILKVCFSGCKMRVRFLNLSLEISW